MLTFSPLLAVTTGVSSLTGVTLMWTVQGRLCFLISV